MRCSRRTPYRSLAALGVAALTSIAALVAAPVARAQALTEDENTRLMHGDTIRREQTVLRGEHRYVGGITYTVVEATAPELERLLDDVDAYRRILPRTKSAQLVGRDGGDFFVELRQGNALYEAAYTLRIRKDPAAHEVRFWLDPTRPHGISDAWGFFRYEPLAQVAPGVPRVLFTFGILVDLGPGLVRDLFEERLRQMMLTVPQRLRQYVHAAIRAPRPARLTARL